MIRFIQIRSRYIPLENLLEIYTHDRFFATMVFSTGDIKISFEDEETFPVFMDHFAKLCQNGPDSYPVIIDLVKELELCCGEIVG